MPTTCICKILKPPDDCFHATMWRRISRKQTLGARGHPHNGRQQTAALTSLLQVPMMCAVGADDVAIQHAVTHVAAYDHHLATHDRR
jgi:hypothetical protein